MVLDYTITIPNTTIFNSSTWTPNYTYWYTGATIYKYQIFCPKRNCKQSNWLELDKPQACANCGSILKAVSEKVDFEVEISK